MRLPKNRPRPPAAGALCQGVDPDFAWGPFYKNIPQNFKFNIFKIQPTLVHVLWLTGHDTIKRKFIQFPLGKTHENDYKNLSKSVLFVFDKNDFFFGKQKVRFVFSKFGTPKVLKRLAGYNTL